MAQSTSSGPLVTIYEDRIGTVTNANEAVGYWAFLSGVVLGLLGLIAYFLTDAATMGRGVAYALAALAPGLLMTGAVLRFPLRERATYLVVVGGLLTFGAVTWFLLIFPDGWSTATGNAGVIVTYVLGLGIVGVAGSVVPLTTDQREAGAEEKVQAAEEAATAAHRKLDDAEQTNERNSEREAALQSEIAELETETDELRSEIADAEADERDLAASLHSLRTSQAQFEHYEDDDGEYRWRLRHRNGNVVATSSSSYTQRHNAKKGIQSVRRNALGAATLPVETEADLADDGTTDGLLVSEDQESQAEFEIYTDDADQYRWRLRHDNGNIIAGCGEGYASRDSAEHSIDRIREYVGPADYLQPDPTAIEVYQDRASEWRWRLVHQNGNVLASSGEGYANRGGARGSIDRLREEIPDIEIGVYEDDGGEYRWRLVGGDGRVKADSDGYESRDGAEAAVNRVREFMPNADLIDIGQTAFEVYEDDGGEYRWRLRHRNGNVLADGREGYADRSGTLQGIESVKQNAPGAGL